MMWRKEDLNQFQEQTATNKQILVGLSKHICMNVNRDGNCLSCAVL